MSLTGHMSEPSWKMGGGSMRTELDDGNGRAIGSKITLRGKVLGATLSISEVITERAPPHRKVWETVGIPQMLVIGAYRMGFEVEASAQGSTIRIFIEYSLPHGAYLLGRLFGKFYAQWCTAQMAHDAQKHFQHAA